MTSDRHIRRSGDDYTYAFLSMLPQGQAWPRGLDTTLVRACSGLNKYWGYVDGRAADLLERESDPRATIELLPDWERAWGLPDPCLPEAISIAERQRMLVLVMTWMGGQSRAYFEWVMAFIGFEIHIQEFSPFMVGVSQVGDTRPPDVTAYTSHYRWYIGPPEMRFSWTMRVGKVGLQWFRAANGQAGVDPHLRIYVPDDIQCLIDRWKPAHTDLVFDFSGDVAFSDPMAGTP